MATTLQLGDIALDVVRKDIKNIHLSVYPPTGAVRIAAPSRMSLDSIRLFAIQKLDWIRHQQKTVREQDREGAREYLDRESHYIWGQRYLLKLIESDTAPSVQISHSKLILHVRPGATAESRASLLAGWHRLLLKAAIPSLIESNQARLGVTVRNFFVQQMRTKWGSCNPDTGTIRVNTELARKPRECLEYIVLHEMAHLIDRKHGPRFLMTMDRYMPDWRQRQSLLNRLPVRHEQWTY